MLERLFQSITHGIDDVLWGALLPRLSRLAEESQEAFRRTFNLFFGVVTVLLGPIALGGYLVGPDLVEFLYKGKFSEAGDVFKVLAVSYAMLAVSTFLGHTLLAQNRQKWYLLPLVISALTAIVSIRLLVPEHGGIGASWGMIISHGLLFVTLASINFRNFNLLLGQTWLGCIPAFLVMALVVSRLQGMNVLIQVIAGGGIFLILTAPSLMRLRRLSQPPVELVTE